MQKLITIKEASQLTGKHPDTIRRLIKDNLNSKNISKDKKGKYLLDRGWLISQFDTSQAPESDFKPEVDNQPIQPEQSALAPVIEALTNQLTAKDEQIAKLQALLSEKEANTTKLQNQFQHLLARQTLPANIDVKPDTAYATYADPMPADEPVPRQNTTKPTPKKKQTKKPAKKKSPVTVIETKPVKKKKFLGIFGKK